MALLAVAFVAGLGVTTLGRSGVFLTAVLATFTAYSPGAVAGMMSVVLFFGSLVGAFAYRQSGELDGATGRRLVVALGGTAVAGAFVGSQANAYLSAGGFSSGLRARGRVCSWSARCSATGTSQGMPPSSTPG